MKVVEGSVLVTGGAGFIGSHVATELLKEPIDRLVIFDSESALAPVYDQFICNDRVDLVTGDIRDYEQLHSGFRNIDYVFHLAATCLQLCQQIPVSATSTNIVGTFNVLRAAVVNDVKRLVFASSSSVYGSAVAVPMTEEHPFNCRTFYGVSKVAGELLCRAFNEKYKLDYVGLRYMNVYGPGQHVTGPVMNVISKMLVHIDADQSLTVFGDGSQTRGFTYVGDTAEASILALKLGKSDSIYNICSDTETTIKELAELLLDVTGSDVGIHYVPDADVVVSRRLGSGEKAKTDLGFTAQVPLREGLGHLLEWRNKLPDMRVYNI